MSTAWRSQPERGNRNLIRLLAWMTLRLGRPVARWFLYPICLYFVLFSGGTQRISREYLQRILTRPVRWKDIFRHYHAFASTIHDRVYLLSGRHRYFDIRMEGASALHAILAQKRGCILLGSHLGSFEVLRAHGLFDQQLPITVIMHDGSKLYLKKVAEDYNPTDKLAALRLMHETAHRGEFATGILYVEPDKDDLIAQLNMVDEPLAALPLDRIRPGRDVLDAVMDEHR